MTTPRLEDFQRRFIQYLRNARKYPAPQGVAARRMAIYVRSVQRDFENVLSAYFPVLRQVLGHRRWRNLVRDFIERHACQTPVYHRVTDEFMVYLNREKIAQKKDPVFLRALAHYEWKHLSLYLQEEKARRFRVDPKGDLIKGVPVFAPVLELLSYPFQVHRIGRNYRPKKPDPERSYYLAFRNRRDDLVFLLLEPTAAKWVALLLRGRKLKRDTKAVRPLLQELRRHQAILGTRHSKNSSYLSGYS